MRKILAILLTVFMAVGMTACLEEETSTPKQDSQSKNSQKTENSLPEIELPEVWFD